MIRVAIVGVGYWGPNLVRNLDSMDGASVVALCDVDRQKMERVASRIGSPVELFHDPAELARRTDVDAVVIATPIDTHHDLGCLFLRAGKHVFLEKPLAATVEQCEDLIGLSRKHGRVLMVGHVFEFNMAVRRVKRYLDEGDLGKLFYIYSQRLNLGRIQKNLSAMWSFAPHDISIMNYWLGAEPVRVSARGFSYLSGGVEDVTFMTLDYPNGVGAHLHLGWLDPRKVRLMTLVGSKKMVVYDDVSIDQKLRVFDKGIVDLDEYLESPDSYAEFQFQIRTGDEVIPTLNFGEPLRAECEHFIECIDQGKTPLTDGINGLRTVTVLEAAEKSLLSDGAPICLQTD